MAYTIIKPKDRMEWLKHRESGIGSSEVGTILGLNPFETPYQLWRRKKGLDAPKQENFAMKAGHYLEDAVSMFYKDETGREIIKSSAGDWLIVNTDKPYMRVSPDRTFWLPDAPHSKANKGILECKTTQLEIDENDLPKHWLCQITYQLGVAELQYGALAWLTQGRSFGYRDIVFDKEFYQYITDEVEHFWIDNIQGNKEPLPISVEDILIKNPRSVQGKSIVADNEIIEQISELYGIKDQIKECTARKEELEKNIKMFIGDAESLVVEGEKKPLATWKTGKDRVKFDEKRFKEEHSDLYNQYLITTAGNRTFLLK